MPVSALLFPHLPIPLPCYPRSPLPPEDQPSFASRLFDRIESDDAFNALAGSNRSAHVLLSMVTDSDVAAKAKEALGGMVPLGLDSVGPNLLAEVSSGHGAADRARVGSELW